MALDIPKQTKTNLGGKRGRETRMEGKMKTHEHLNRVGRGGKDRTESTKENTKI